MLVVLTLSPQPPPLGVRVAVRGRRAVDVGRLAPVLGAVTMLGGCFVAVDVVVAADVFVGVAVGVSKLQFWARLPATVAQSCAAEATWGAVTGSTTVHPMTSMITSATRRTDDPKRGMMRHLSTASPLNNRCRWQDTRCIHGSTDDRRTAGGRRRREAWQDGIRKEWADRDGVHVRMGAAASIVLLPESL